MNFGKEISILLLQHNCVVIPSFGGFVADTASATYNPALHLMMPPHKNVVFNKHLVNNDGLLANHIAKTYSISFTEASAKLNLFIAEIKQELIGRRRVTLENTGVLFLDETGNIQFTQDHNINYFNESFGLGNLRLTPVIRAKQTKVPEFPEAVETPVIQLTEHISKESSSKRWLKIAAVAVGLPIVGVTLFLALKKPVSQFAQQSSIFGFMDNSGPAYVPADVSAALTPIIKEELTALSDSDGMFALKISSSKNIKPLLVKIEAIADTSRVVKPELNRITSNREYYIIVGCFANPENASRLVTTLQLEGKQGAIAGVAKNGLTRVGLGVFYNFENANSQLAAVKQNYPNAWIYEKR
jgi:hypothetical protein